MYVIDIQHLLIVLYMQILVADRTRGGQGQWATRGSVVRMCEKHLLKEEEMARRLQRLDGRGLEDAGPGFCYRTKKLREGGEVSHKDFLQMMANVPFVACPHGGGIDPSPKAWEALLVGSIPIIQRGFVDDAYGIHHYIKRHISYIIYHISYIIYHIYVQL
jgi:hypothetical protein